MFDFMINYLIYFFFIFLYLLELFSFILIFPFLCIFYVFYKSLKKIGLINPSFSLIQYVYNFNSIYRPSNLNFIIKLWTLNLSDNINNVINVFTSLNKKKSFSTNLNFLEFSNVYKCHYFIHNGHLGDIIYSLALLNTIYKHTNRKLTLIVISDDLNDLHLQNHPSAQKINSLSFMISSKSYLSIKPFIESQSYINKCMFMTRDQALAKYRSIDLSKFRLAYINTAGGDISLYYEKLLGVPIDSYSSWLIVKKNPKYKNHIVVGRSFRYRNNSINYSFLNQLNNLIFIGLKDEFLDFKKRYKLKKIRFVKIKNISHAAEIIYSSKFFIGNQSLFFSIAEGLKSDRYLESYEPAPNVIPKGGKTLPFLYDFHLIDHLNLNYNLKINYKKKIVAPSFILNQH